jgi:hypothetical protein
LKPVPQKAFRVVPQFLSIFPALFHLHGFSNGTASWVNQRVVELLAFIIKNQELEIGVEVLKSAITWSCVVYLGQDGRAEYINPIDKSIVFRMKDDSFEAVQTTSSTDETSLTDDEQDDFNMKLLVEFAVKHLDEEFMLALFGSCMTEIFNFLHNLEVQDIDNTDYLRSFFLIFAFFNHLASAGGAVSAAGKYPLKAIYTFTVSSTFF